MEVIINKESYMMVQRMAGKYCFGNTLSVRYERMFSAGLEGLLKAVKAYDESKGTKFYLFARKCVHNAMVNERLRYDRCSLEMEDDYDLSMYDKEASGEPVNDWGDIVGEVISKEMNGNDRNIKIARMYLGVDRHPMKMKDIASAFNLSHESVRLVCKRAVNAIKANREAKAAIMSYLV